MSDLTLDIVSQTLAEFDWPETYTLEDDLPDGIVVAFPKCRLYFAADPDGSVELSFLDIGSEQEEYGLIDALSEVTPGFDKNPDPFAELPLHNDYSVGSSPEKVRNNIRDICLILKTYLMPVLKGNHSHLSSYE